MAPARPDQAHIEALFRQHHGRVFARLVSVFGDFDVAEDALQDAFVAALTRWPERGVPASTVGWIFTVARNAALSVKRHQAVVQRKHDELRAAPPPAATADEDADIPDERLRLLFTCCHPALAREARVALTLRTVCGLSTATIARLFLAGEPTVAQRLVRAKRKIRNAAIPYAVPPAERLTERLDDVLACVYLLFTEGYAGADGTTALRPALCDEAIRLGRLLTGELPTHPEARGLLALMLLHDARRGGRLDAQGELLALEEQDRSRWERRTIDEGQRMLDEALARRQPGPYQIQAAIAALHASAESYAGTDWPQVAGLYAELFRREPSPAIAVSMVIAEAMANSPEHGLQLLDQLIASGQLPADFDRIAAARADLWRRAGHPKEARAAYTEALQHARHPREARFLERRMALCDAMPSSEAMPSPEADH